MTENPKYKSANKFMLEIYKAFILISKAACKFNCWEQPMKTLKPNYVDQFKKMYSGLVTHINVSKWIQF